MLHLASPITGTDEIIYRQLCDERVLQDIQPSDFSSLASILLYCPDFRRSNDVLKYIIEQQKGTTLSESGLHLLGNTGGAALLDPSHHQCTTYPDLYRYLLAEIGFAITGLNISHVILQAHYPCGRQTACGYDLFNTLTSLDRAGRHLRNYLESQLDDANTDIAILLLFDIHTKDGMRTYRLDSEQWTRFVERGTCLLETSFVVSC
jgi:hypothetical protein